MLTSKNASLELLFPLDFRAFRPLRHGDSSSLPPRCIPDLLALAFFLPFAEIFGMVEALPGVSESRYGGCAAFPIRLIALPSL